MISFLQNNYDLQATEKSETVQKEWEESLDAYKISCEIFEQNMEANKNELLYETARFEDEIMRRKKSGRK